MMINIKSTMWYADIELECFKHYILEAFLSYISAYKSIRQYIISIELIFIPVK